MEMMLWNIVLTGIVAIIGFLTKGKFDELDRLGALLNKTREEIARDHVTRAEFNQTFDKLATRLDDNFRRLEDKIEELAKRGRG
jgi:predicted nuclease with TOPRIM domain